jgi:iron complex outermembrane receptor protein
MADWCRLHACAAARRRFWRPAALGLSAVTALSGPAWGTSEAGDSEGGVQLEEIVVTARKRQEDLQSIPLSVSALSATQMADAHVSKMDDLSFLVPNLNITTRADNTPDVVLRGVGAFGVTQGVGFYVNDVQQFEGQTVRPEDLDRIEVLKGPQGTLYGGNNIGGAIKYITRKPSADLQMQATSEFGNLDTRNFSGALSGPIVGEDFRGRLSAFDATSDGFVYDTTLNQTLGHSHESGARLTLEYEEGGTDVAFYLSGNRLRSSNENLYYAADSTDSYTRTVTSNVLPHFDRNLYSPTLQIDHTFNDVFKLTSITSYFHSDVNARADGDHIALPLFDVTQIFHKNIWSEELRLAAETGKLTWLLGAFIQQRDSRDLEANTQMLSVITGNPADDGIVTSANVARRREYAGFANASYPIGKLTLEAGVRVEHFQNRLTDTFADKTLEVSGTNLLPKVSLSYHFEPDIMGYVSVAGGLQPADILQAHGEISSFASEKTQNYELGLKSTLLDDRLRFNFAAFYIKYQNRLFSTIDGRTLLEVTNNVGPSHNYGFEFDLIGRLTRELTLSGGFGVTRAVWDNIPGYFNPNTGATINLNGLIAPYTPSYQGTLALEWRHPLPGDLVLGMRVSGAFTGPQWWNISDDYGEKAYQILGAGLILDVGRHWQLRADGTNLLDKQYHTVFAAGPDIGSPRNTAGFSRPRQWFISATARF